MGTREVLEAGRAMDDDAVRERVAAGDFSDLTDLRLDEHEQAFLKEAATRYDPEVAGFATTAFSGFLSNVLTPLVSATSEDHPQESVSLNYGKIKWTYSE